MPAADVKMTVRVPRALVMELSKIATKRRRTRSEIARFALEEYVDRSQP